MSQLARLELIPLARGVKEQEEKGSTKKNKLQKDEHIKEGGGASSRRLSMPPVASRQVEKFRIILFHVNIALYPCDL